MASRLAEAESHVKESKLSLTNCKRQTQTDNEIITYLDNRVNELETIMMEVTRESSCQISDLEMNLTTYRTRLDVSDSELSQLREKYEQEENIFKSQKKLLIKEVKALRSLNAQTSSERDEVRVQLERVKKLINHKF